ncbi:hypothetical protein ACSBM8_15055 [Sphingomonas sp. ASY06-1R]|uniref:hypothetical protein n=1 Tax=Sphingomonas sp. ASY06-1R TaxID=3445771 RepID=UPI003FA1B0E8
MKTSALPLVLLLPFFTSGCVVGTAWDLASLPVKATTKVVDWSTTDQAEADRKAGRDMRLADRQREHRDNRQCRDFSAYCDGSE